MSSSADIAVVPIPHDLMEAVLPHLMPHLAVGIEFSKLNPEKVGEEIKKDLTQVWGVFRDKRDVLAALLTSICKEDDGTKLLDVYGMAGNGILSWGQKVSDTLVEFARLNGCRRVTCVGRKALMKAYGKDVRIVGERGGIFAFERLV